MPSISRLVRDDLVPAQVAARGRYSASFLAAIDAGLVVRPERRPQTLQDFRNGFNRSEPSEPDITLPATESAAVDLALEPPAPPAAPAPASRRLWWFLAGAVALGALAWAVFGRR
jgi:hypothetical protein